MTDPDQLHDAILRAVASTRVERGIPAAVLAAIREAGHHIIGTCATCCLVERSHNRIFGTRLTCNYIPTGSPAEESPEVEPDFGCVHWEAITGDLDPT